MRQCGCVLAFVKVGYTNSAHRGRHLFRVFSFFFLSSWVAPGGENRWSGSSGGESLKPAHWFSMEMCLSVKLVNTLDHPFLSPCYLLKWTGAACRQHGRVQYIPVLAAWQHRPRCKPNDDESHWATLWPLKLQGCIYEMSCWQNNGKDYVTGRDICHITTHLLMRK